MSLTYTIQGFDFHQPDQGFQLMDGSLFAPSVNPRRVDVQPPGMHGQIPLWNDELQPQKLTLRVRIRDDDPSQLQFKWEHLRALMWTGSNQGLTIRRDSAGQVTSTFGQLEAMSEPAFWCAAGMVDTTILLNIPSGRWQSINTFEESLDTSMEDQSLDFVNEGTAPNTNPLFRFQGPWTSSGAWNRVRDMTSQTGFWIFPGSGSLTSDDYVIVDPANYKAWLNTTDDWDAREFDISSGLESDLNGMLSLVNVPTFQIGVRDGSITTNRSASASDTELVVQGRKTYI